MPLLQRNSCGDGAGGKKQRASVVLFSQLSFQKALCPSFPIQPVLKLAKEEREEMERQFGGRSGALWNCSVAFSSSSRQAGQNVPGAQETPFALSMPGRPPWNKWPGRPGGGNSSGRGLGGGGNMCTRQREWVENADVTSDQAKLAFWNENPGTQK